MRPNSFKEADSGADSEHLVIALTTFDGLLTLENGMATAATFSLDDDNTLELQAGGIKLGRWPANEWEIFSNGTSFSIRVESETLTFDPEDREAFRSTVAESIGSPVDSLVGAIDTPLKSVADLVDAVTPPEAPPPPGPDPVSEPETVADEIRARAEDEEPEDDEEEPRGDRLRAVLIGVGAAALLLLLIVTVIVLVSGEPTPGEVSSTEPPPASTPSTAVPAPTVASTPVGGTATGDTETTTTTLASETPSIFEMTPRGFVATWNSVARRFRVPVELPPDYADTLGRHSFSPYLTLETEGTDTVDLIRFIGDPAGDPVSDQIMLATLGVTISVVEPDLDAPGRADLLAQLGLDVRNPILPGLFSTLDRHGATYTLVFDEEADVLVLEVRPSG